MQVGQAYIARPWYMALPPPKHPQYFGVDRCLLPVGGSYRAVEESSPWPFSVNFHNRHDDLIAAHS